MKRNPPNHVRETRYPELGFRQDAPGLWRVVDVSTGSSVGPQYSTRSELLADLARYAADGWGLV